MSSSCTVWFDISPKVPPRPFRIAEGEDVFKMWAERKWYKNFRIFPSEFPTVVSTTKRQNSSTYGIDLGASNVPISKVDGVNLEPLKKALLARLQQLLLLPPDHVNEYVALVQYGIDSLIAVELRSWFWDEVNIELSVFDILQKTASVASCQLYPLPLMKGLLSGHDCTISYQSLT